MPHSNHFAILSVCSAENQVKEFFFVIFQVPSQGVRTHIRYLNHAGKLTIDK